MLGNCTGGDLRLVGGTNEYEGRVEICVNRVWGTICYSSSRYSNYWGVSDGAVVCRQLGHQDKGTTIHVHVYIAQYHVVIIDH